MLKENFLVDWNAEKNNFLKKERKVSFEMVEILILEKKYLGIIKNISKNFPEQLALLVNIDDYIYYIPFVIDKKRKIIFLKTIIPSRKLTKKILNNK